MAPKLIPAAYRAPEWKPDRSEFIVLWHGTTSFARRSIEAGIDLATCAVDTDFGRGFYTSTLERQARLWAWEQLYRRQTTHPTETGVQPVVC